jgi:hypothetical protein
MSKEGMCIVVMVTVLVGDEVVTKPSRVYHPENAENKKEAGIYVESLLIARDNGTRKDLLAAYLCENVRIYN